MSDGAKREKLWQATAHRRNLGVVLAGRLRDGDGLDGGGALRSYPLDRYAEQVELVILTDGRQLSVRVELLNAPNNPIQTFEAFTNNGMLNPLTVCFNTPDPGNTVRIINLAPVEFPCYIHLKPSLSGDKFTD